MEYHFRNNEWHTQIGHQDKDSQAQQVVQALKEDWIAAELEKVFQADPVALGAHIPIGKGMVQG